MIQQVNLFHDRLIQGTGQSVLNNYIYGLCCIACILFTYSGYTVWQSFQAKSAVNKAQQTLTATEAHLNAIQLQHPKQKINQLIISEINLLQGKKQSIKQVISLLTDTQSDRSLGFSGYLNALAKQAHAEIWLRSILINIEESVLTLEGSTFKAAAVPELLQRLQHEATFRGLNFTKLSMLESTNLATQIDFTLSTSDISAEKI